MGAKSIQVSIDGGSTFLTLPGNTGDFNDNTKSVDDTIFGQNFKSSQTDLIDWTVTANAVYKGYAGYSVTVKQTGSTTAFTTEATTQIGSTKSYQITNAAKQVFDPAVTVHVFDNAVNKDIQVLNIDYLFGIVTFLSAYTVTGPVTISGSYLPLAALAKYQKYTLTQSMAPIETTDMPTAQGNGGQSTFIAGLTTISMSVDGVYSVTNAYRAAITARNVVVLEICPDGGGKSVARGFFKPMTRKQSGNVGALEVETMSWELQVPTNQNLLIPFHWNFTSSDLSQSVQNILNSFINQTAVNVKYLPDGGTTMNAGLTGQAYISDTTLTGGIGAMNTFAVTFQGTGAATAV